MLISKFVVQLNIFYEGSSMFRLSVKCLFGFSFVGLNVKHLDVLEADWAEMAAARGGSLNIIANLPYYIVSQVLFSLADSHKAIDTAVVTMQVQ
jgi:16S rRNA A1518/A1519 N6-dimethyltransferase RsmA/KsgA/DIM1 with predicted DNA glycosylase/AP lyase activity